MLHCLARRRTVAQSSLGSDGTLGAAEPSPNGSGRTFFKAKAGEGI